ncbi:MAG: Methylated-DNA--protein-cysteine methyltransferase [Syntrophorhabdaceae bacterium PtaU1.Bin034]|nr:MAG: Methylated-DNA--protein-cysteine methyltransferase [Syntrophorhabdaceae bacterium PtaU1.Bin034]
MKKTGHSYRIIETPVGKTGIVCLSGTRPKIVHIFLPTEDLRQAVSALFPDAREADDGESSENICRSVLEWFTGPDWTFDSSRLDQGCCYNFQKRVLLETAAVPRGKVTTYGSLAAQLSVPGAARAVGTALGRNPFPLVIPCHRVVRSDGSLGGFGGGLPMKRKLLEMEGVEFDAKGRVKPEYIMSPDSSRNR